MWILAAAARRRNRGSGKNMFAQRIAEELISVVEGRSSVWDQERFTQARRCSKSEPVFQAKEEVGIIMLATGMVFTLDNAGANKVRTIFQHVQDLVHNLWTNIVSSNVHIVIS